MSEFETNHEAALNQEIDAHFIDEQSGNEVLIVLNHDSGTKTVSIRGKGYFGGDAVYEYQVPIDEELPIPDGGKVLGTEEF